MKDEQDKTVRINPIKGFGLFLIATIFPAIIIFFYLFAVLKLELIFENEVLNNLLWYLTYILAHSAGLYIVAKRPWRLSMRIIAGLSYVILCVPYLFIISLYIGCSLNTAACP